MASMSGSARSSSYDPYAFGNTQPGRRRTRLRRSRDAMADHRRPLAALHRRDDLLRGDLRDTEHAPSNLVHRLRCILCEERAARAAICLIVDSHETTRARVPPARMRGDGAAGARLAEASRSPIFYRRVSAGGVCRQARRGDEADRRRGGDHPGRPRDVGGSCLPAEQPVFLPHRRRGAAGDCRHRRQDPEIDALPRAAAARALQRAGAWSG